MRQKARDIEAEARRVQEDKRAMQEAHAVAMQKLEADRADFANHIAASRSSSNIRTHLSPLQHILLILLSSDTLILLPLTSCRHYPPIITRRYLIPLAPGFP